MSKWTRFLGVPSDEMSNYIKLNYNKNSIIYFSKHPFAILNNHIIDIGIILECISEYQIKELIHPLKKIYDDKISSILNDSKLIDALRDHINEEITHIIFKKLLIPLDLNKINEFVRLHKSHYYNMMDILCKYKGNKEIIICDQLLIDEYLLRTKYDIGCFTLTVFSSQYDFKNFSLSSNNLSSFLQSRNTILIED